MATSEQAAAAAASEILGGSEEVSEEETSSTEVEETSTQEDIVFPTFDIELPPGLREELEEPDDDDPLREDDISALSERYEDADEELLQRLAKAERRAAHFEQLRVSEAKKNWAAEAKKFFPLSEPFLDEITASSRRGFLRTAKNVHDRMVPIVEEKVLKPAREAMGKTKEEVTAEAKEAAAKAWGVTVEDDTKQAPPPPVQRDERRARRGDFSDTIRAMLFTKES